MKKLISLLVILILIGGTIYLIYREGSLPVNSSDKTNKIFTIKKGQSVTMIANNLSNEGLIRNKIVFYAVIKQKGYDKKIQAGDFRLSPSMDVYKVAETLTHGTLDKWVTIIEGLRKEEVASIMAKDFNVTETEFNQLATEGYLFPDTYLIPTDATTERIIEIMKNNFDQKYTSEIASKAAKQKLTKDQVITLASIVEKEALGTDRQQVANILLKRLHNNWPLQADATVQYALGYQVKEKRWWKRYTDLDDLKIESPYNTYKNPGLPPGPICSPGVSSIEAVVNADDETPYFFYLHDKEGNVHYAKTNEEHEKNIQKYLQ